MTTTSSAVGTAHIRVTPIVPRGTLGKMAEERGKNAEMQSLECRTPI